MGNAHMRMVFRRCECDDGPVRVDVRFELKIDFNCIENIINDSTKITKTTFKSLFHRNAFPQKSHTYGFATAPAWNSRCLFRLRFDRNDFSH